MSLFTVGLSSPALRSVLWHYLCPGPSLLRRLSAKNALLKTAEDPP